MDMAGNENTNAIASIFAITAQPPTVRLTPDGSGAVTFTVSYTGAARADAVPFPAHANLVPQTPAIAPWLALEGPSGRRFAPNSTEVYTVTVALPADAAPGTYAFRLDMVGDENPDEQYTQGPAVALDVSVAALPARGKLPSWLWIVLAAVAVLIVGGVLAIVLTRGKGGALTVTNAAVTNVTREGATFTFTTNKAACGIAEFRKAGDPQFTSGIDTLTCPAARATTAHTIVFTGLAPGTTFEVMGAAKDTAGAVSRSAPQIFATMPASATPTVAPATAAPLLTPTVAPTVTPPTIGRIIVAADTATGVRVSFQVSKDGSAEIMYSNAPDTNGTLVNPIVAPAQPVQANAIAERALTNLARGTRYSYVITATDATGATVTTPVQHFMLTRGIVVTLKSLNVLNPHNPTPNPASTLQCNTTLRYGVSERYASGPADERLHNFAGPSPGAISIPETFAEDPNRAITVEITGTFTPQTAGTVKVGDGGLRPACLPGAPQNLAPAMTTLNPADNFAVGKDLTLVSADCRTDIHLDEQLSVSTT
jgi:hypothetical protein